MHTTKDKHDFSSVPFISYKRRPRSIVPIVIAFAVMVGVLLLLSLLMHSHAPTSEITSPESTRVSQTSLRSEITATKYGATAPDHHIR